MPGWQSSLSIPRACQACEADPQLSYITQLAVVLLCAEKHTLIFTLRSITSCPQYLTSCNYSFDSFFFLGFEDFISCVMMIVVTPFLLGPEKVICW